MYRANGTTIVEEWDNGKRVESKKETAKNEEDSAKPAVSGSDEGGFAATPSDDRGHHAHPQEHGGHSGDDDEEGAGGHQLDLDLGELPTLWYGETHQIRTDETLTPVQGRLSSYQSVSKIL